MAIPMAVGTALLCFVLHYGCFAFNGHKSGFRTKDFGFVAGHASSRRKLRAARRARSIFKYCRVVPVDLSAIVHPCVCAALRACCGHRRCDVSSLLVSGWVAGCRCGVAVFDLLHYHLLFPMIARRLPSCAGCGCSPFCRVDWLDMTTRTLRLVVGVAPALVMPPCDAAMYAICMQSP